MDEIMFDGKIGQNMFYIFWFVGLLCWPETIEKR